MAFSFSKVFSTFRSNQLRNEVEHAHSRKLQINAIELEARVLYSASPFEGDVGDQDVAALLGDIEDSDLGTDSSESETRFSGDLVSVENRSLLDLDLQIADEFRVLGPELPSVGQEIVFIDSGVKGWQLLLDDLQSTSEGPTNLSIVLLDTNRDGIEQIGEALASHQDLAAIHLISHGDAGQLRLGKTALSSQNISAYAGEIANWNDSLSDGADLLIYGCDLASNEDGRFLAASLGELCNCDVAASDDTTGHDSLGGDWDLEYGVGAITTDVAFNSHAQSSWQGLLATYTVTNTNDSGAGSLRQAILDANANAGVDTIEFNIALTDSGHVYYQDDGIADQYK